MEHANTNMPELATVYFHPQPLAGQKKWWLIHMNKINKLTTLPKKLVTDTNKSTNSTRTIYKNFNLKWLLSIWFLFSHFLRLTWEEFTHPSGWSHSSKQQDLYKKVFMTRCQISYYLSFILHYIARVNITYKQCQQNKPCLKYTFLSYKQDCATAKQRQSHYTRRQYSKALFLRRAQIHAEKDIFILQNKSPVLLCT